MDSLTEVIAFRKLIGNKINMLRHNKKLTQVELGKALGYKSTGTISQIESGERGIQLISIMKFAQFFGVHPAVLISPVLLENYSDLELLDKVIHLLELQREKPEVAKPLLQAIKGLLEHIPSA